MPLFQTILFLAISNTGVPTQAPAPAHIQAQAIPPVAYTGIDLNGNTYLSIDPQAVWTGSELCPDPVDNNANANPKNIYLSRKPLKAEG